jgi:uncharacterized alpha-E superfamily protein
MLSRTAASLYWLGRYVERAEFTARIVEATVRLDALSSRPAGEAAWASALAVLEADDAYAETGQPITAQNVAEFLTLATGHPGSVVSCLDSARDNARAVRTALTREAWSAINRAWLLFRGRTSAGDTQETLNLVEQAEAETRGFEGAVNRMMRHPSYWFIRLGASVERGDNTARLLDVKYHILLPEDEKVGGAVDRDQWTTILQTVSAVNAYRWIYSEGLKPARVTELLVLRKELPRSLVASAETVVQHLSALGKYTGIQGEADRLARGRYARLGETRIDAVIAGGLHEYLEAFNDENAALDRAIARQFRFV